MIFAGGDSPLVAWVVGCPISGKTTLARALALELSEQRKKPILVIDSAEVEQFSTVQVNTPEEAAEALWGASPHGHARVVPTSLEQMDRLCRAVRAGGDVILLVDEAHFWLSAQSGVSSELVRIMRATQHCRVDVILTTQHLTGDVPQAALSCTTNLFVFRCTSPRVIRTLESEWGLEGTATLAQFDYLEQQTGF